MTGLEANIKVAGVLGVDAEGVHGTLRVGFRVCVEPLFCDFRLVKFIYQEKRQHSPVCAFEPV